MKLMQKTIILLSVTFFHFSMMNTMMMDQEEELELQHNKVKALKGLREIDEKRYEEKLAFMAQKLEKLQSENSSLRSGIMTVLDDMTAVDETNKKLKFEMKKDQMTSYLQYKKERDMKDQELSILKEELQTCTYRLRAPKDTNKKALRLNPELLGTMEPYQSTELAIILGKQNKLQDLEDDLDEHQKGSEKLQDLITKLELEKADLHDEIEKREKSRNYDEQLAKRFQVARFGLAVGIGGVCGYYFNSYYRTQRMPNFLTSIFRKFGK